MKTVVSIFLMSNGPINASGLSILVSYIILKSTQIKTKKAIDNSQYGIAI